MIKNIISFALSNITISLIFVAVGFFVLLLAFYLVNYKQVNVFVVKFTGKKRIQKKIFRECKQSDFLTISNIYFQVSENGYHKIDTLIIGNKYIYIVSIIPMSGDAIINSYDDSWRIVHYNKLTEIKNPLNRSRRFRSFLSQNIEGIEENDVKSIICFAKTCKFEKIQNIDNEFTVSENEIINFISKYEKESNDDIIDPKEAEKYINFFYRLGLENQKIIKKGSK